MSGRSSCSPLTRTQARRGRRRSTAAGKARRSSPASEKGSGRPARFRASPSDSLHGAGEDDEAELLRPTARQGEHHRAGIVDEHLG